MPPKSSPRRVPCPKTILDRLWVKRDDAIQVRRSTFASDRRTPGTSTVTACCISPGSGGTSKDHQRAVWVDPGLFDLLSGRMQAAATPLADRAPASRSSCSRAIAHRSGTGRSKVLPGGRCISRRGRPTSPCQASRACPDPARSPAVVGAGGIGLYDRFTHVDTGSPRAWGVAANRQGDHHG